MRTTSIRPSGSRGFSLIELVIVIALITALGALALPALKGAHLRSKKTAELSRLRQVGMAWYLYAQSNNDHALPGYIEPDVQKAWEVEYEYPDIIAGADLRERVIPAEVAAPWTWRLMPFLNDAGRSMRGHYSEDEQEPLSLIENSLQVSLEPGFGYNGYYVGGHWRMTSGSRPRPTYRFASARDLRGKRVNVVARSPSDIRDSARLLVFCSSSLRSVGRYQRTPGGDPGYHLAVPPMLAEEPHWTVPREPMMAVDYQDLPMQGRGDAFMVEALRKTPTPLGRYTGAAAVFYADGHTDSQTPGALDDQSKWIMAAEQVKDVPANRFTHTED